MKLNNRGNLFRTILVVFVVLVINNGYELFSKDIRHNKLICKLEDA